ncbi:hypothetical protein [Mycoplasmopsis bovis]|nr:hypothetical protein [Mycoplasmopsis bovis]AXJ68538.1 hypothetical protein CH319_02270 [Mycoplasmopsis bovis]AXJ74207.1 hypothetical protein CH315_02310 [Mycoplasmopsis bovis]MBT1316215.1 hypothetical protein [Mycoplasmopsis bovis]MBT1317332.1 hypothetical protein [Mycoplasmopsis bovis]MBT1321080.1 hypothetical protein [Mycoplasmopsis bovis]
MITALVIWIMNAIPASVEAISRVLPMVKDPEVIDQIMKLDIYSFFNTLTRVEKAATYFALVFELTLWAWGIMLFFTRWIPQKLRDKKNKSVDQVNMLKSIKWKLENNMALSKSEQKFYKKYNKSK